MSKQNNDDDEPTMEETLTSAPMTPSQRRATAFMIIWFLVAVGILVGAYDGRWPWQVIYLVILCGAGTGGLGALLGLWMWADLWFGNGNGFGFGDGGGDGGGGGGNGG